MSARLDTKQVWDALLDDPGFTAGMPEAAHAPFRELVDALPVVLEAHLDKKVDLVSFMEAKLAVTEHMLDSGFIGKMTAAIPEEMLPFPAEEMADMMADALKMLRTPLMEMIHNTADYLAQAGVTERQLLANPSGGRFDKRSLAAYDAGTLTIRGLLETQPAALLQNAN